MHCPGCGNKETFVLTAVTYCGVTVTVNDSVQMIKEALEERSQENFDDGAVPEVDYRWVECGVCNYGAHARVFGDFPKRWELPRYMRDKLRQAVV